MADTDSAVGRTVSRRKFVLAGGAIGVAGMAGCLGGGGEEIRISGSSTVFPVSEAAAEEYRAEGADVGFSITSDGSTGGFEEFFIPGDSHINGSSRPILEEELEQIQDNGFDVLEIQCAGDALTAIINNDNDWVECMDYDQLGQIWHPDAENELWSDIDPSWPDEPFELFGPATTSGTFDYWTEEVVGDFRQIRDDFEGTEQDDIIAQGVAGNEYAHGYLPFAYYDNNPGQVTALAVDGGDGCTAPSLEAASEGTYPLARPIFWYVNTEKLRDNESLQDFLRFAVEMTGTASIIAEDIGYVPMNDTEVEENLQAIEDVIDD